ncbi:MAG: transcriptional regulator TrmB [Parcubacteria group bacterium Gr01-1014_18]|nr:MAG: transcriptional regulator TrmB [Parcubacteria group bacterium Greene0416_36]TSC81054.1 MAG: transcriptional regulator TrmB [Parcubacteria group bacterium Gr01-1014_18]TSC98788.1 MAG: transcriptional regulator TrmB [Parcubacteria group bacterium Greene1014_20]TSD06732.1 MAG: transcriptional regulator TrmB [Parcubacteria group bacterium Greene0714_2]
MEDLLQKLGFSLNESKIYLALLELKEAKAGQIALHTRIHRRNVYDSLERLVHKGLAFQSLSKSENYYSPVDPAKLQEIVKEKELALAEKMPELQKIYGENQNSQEAFIYRGLEGVKNYMRDVLRVGEDVYTIGGQLGWFDPRLSLFTEKFFKEIERKKIQMTTLFDESVKDEKERLKHFKGKYKIIPKKYSTDSAIDIFGEYIVSFTGVHFKKIDDDVTIYVIHDKNLAQSYKKWFELMFDRL